MSKACQHKIIYYFAGNPFSDDIDYAVSSNTAQIRWCRECGRLDHRLSLKDEFEVMDCYESVAAQAMSVHSKVEFNQKLDFIKRDDE